MPSFWKSNRASKSHFFFPEQQQHQQGQHTQQHPDLPLPRPHSRPAPVQRTASVADRASNLSNRRSIAILPSTPDEYFAHNDEPNYSFFEDTSAASSPGAPAGLGRSATVVRRDGSGTGTIRGEAAALPPPPQSPIAVSELAAPSSPSWTSYFARSSKSVEEAAVPRADTALMNHAPPKTSSDSGQHTALDRWSQRRLQRLNTEQGFREQRQGGLASPPASDSSSFSGAPVGYPHQHAQPQPQASLHQQQPPPHHHQQQQQSYQASTRSNASPALHSQPQPVSSSRTSTTYPVHEQPQMAHMQAQHQYSPQEAPATYQENNRPQVQQSHSYSHASILEEQQAMASASNGSMSAPKAVRPASNNRQSVQNNGPVSRDAGGVPSFNAAVVPPTTQAPPAYQSSQPMQQQSEVRRATPQPAQTSDDLSEEDVAQLVKDHKELREKYTKVKKYYFEKEDQVKQLQNSLAHQRLSQSRTSLDDSEYTTRFNRLDGLIAQLAFSIRKNWKSIPSWLVGSVNKDAVATGKQEMTAAGRAFISCWLVEEVFDKYFHPDLDTTLSAQLRSVQKNIRRYAPPAQTSEEEDYLIAKVVNWRLSTLEGLQDALRSPQCPANRAQLTDALKEGLVSAISVHLQDPPPADLEGGVHMIVELVVSIAIHLPLESRDVVIEYYMPGHSIVTELMKLESGIPPLTVSVADDAADRASMKSGISDATDTTENPDAPTNSSGGGKKRSMLSALTGGSDRKGRGSAAQGKLATGSSGSLQRPESQSGREDLPPRVRLAAGIGVSVRGRTVLVKAPVFST
ncbi:hypothetical protein MBLNU13_g10916t1 [Cladosporium sp. NU13]